VKGKEQKKKKEKKKPQKNNEWLGEEKESWCR
jgi:hypothetical protein